MTIKLTSAGLILACALYPVTVLAGNWQAGLIIEQSRSPFIAQGTEISAIPIVNYQGERFEFIDGKLQYRLSSEESDQINLSAQARSRQLYTASLDSEDDLGINGMQDRHTAFELGLETSHQRRWGKVSLAAYRDISSKHKGYELSVNYAYPHQLGRWLIEPAMGLQFQSKKLVDYYHGVLDVETLPGRPEYQGKQSLNALMSVTAAYAISPQLLAITRFEQILLDEGITDSPIVNEDESREILLALMYAF